MQSAWKESPAQRATCFMTSIFLTVASSYRSSYSVHMFMMAVSQVPAEVGLLDVNVSRISIAYTCVILRHALTWNNASLQTLTKFPK